MDHRSMTLKRMPLATLFAAVVACTATPSNAQDSTKPAADPPPEKNSAEKAETSPDSTSTDRAKGDAREVALRGYCPVSYHTDGKAMPGDPKHSVEFQGYVYHLADAEKKEKFEKDPEKYIPRLGGLCTVALGGPYGNRFYADPRVFAVVDGKLYLCWSERAKRSFDLRPHHYINRAEELYSQPELDGICPASYQLSNRAVRGVAKRKAVYRGRVYHFYSDEALEVFKEDPEQFLPMYVGYCTEGVSKDALIAPDPRVFVIHDGRTYLFSSLEAQARCLADRPACLEAANRNWKELRKQVGKVPSRR